MMVDLRNSSSSRLLRIMYISYAVGGRLHDQPGTTLWLMQLCQTISTPHAASKQSQCGSPAAFLLEVEGSWLTAHGPQPTARSPPHGIWEIALPNGPWQSSEGFINQKEQLPDSNIYQTLVRLIASSPSQ